MTDDVTDLSRENQRNLRRLVLSIQASYGRLNLLMALSDNWKHRDELIESYETELQSKGVRCYRVRVNRPGFSLKQCLLNLTTSEPGWADGNTVVTVLGADELLGVRLKQDETSSQEKLFFSLQWTREALRQFQIPIVMWLTPQIAGQLANRAPDFWSWRGGVFEFSKPIAWTLADRSVVKGIENLEDKPDSTKANPEDIAKQIAELEAQDVESPLLASLYMDLGAAYETEVHYSKAASAYEQAVRLREKQLGPDHIDTATSLNDLAGLYKFTGRYSDAELLYKRSLKIYERQLGSKHTFIAIGLNNLAAIYSSMGRYADAEPLYKLALEIQESQLAPDALSITVSLSNLAQLYRATGQYADAEPLYKRALEIRESHFGFEHSLTAVSLNDLATLYDATGRYIEAIQLHRHALEIWKSQHGFEHPETAQILNDLAFTYGTVGLYTEAESLYLQSIEIAEKALTSEHPYVEDYKNNFRDLLKKVIATEKTNELSDHPLTQMTLKELQPKQEESS